MEVVKEVTLPELREMIENGEGDFIIHVELMEDMGDGKKEE